MKYIANKKIPLVGRARNFAVLAKAATVDADGAHTTAAHFLCGENPWGFQNDLRFSLPMGAAKVGERIAIAAESALHEDLPVILLSNDDYEVLVSALVEPRRHVTEMPMPPILARAILPVLDSILSAKESL